MQGKRGSHILTGAFLWAVVGALAAAAAPGKIAGARADRGKVRKADYARDVRPILSQNCFPCHGQDEGSRAVGLRLDLRDEAVKDRGGRRAVTPGKPAASRLYLRIIERDPARRMPPLASGHTLSAADVATLRRWIEQGAPYAPHWAFVAPRWPAVPDLPDVWTYGRTDVRTYGRADVRERPHRRGSSTPPHLHTSTPPHSPKNWPRGPIDAFILDRLLKAGLTPAPEADRYTLIRRVSLDLTGLPPTPQEVEAFVNDRSPDAYEKVVDRLLASPHYGERWARMWLDLARYADSAGYGSDPLRHNIWPYRDWVIDAFNRNLPYDRFTILQLAGDLLGEQTSGRMDVWTCGGVAGSDPASQSILSPRPLRLHSSAPPHVRPPTPPHSRTSTLHPLVATAFHRNTMTNTEGGTDDEEFRVAAVKDRIATTAQVWMGLTLGCAQCHSHKYDPISHREYYRFFALFNQTEDADRPDEQPTFPVTTADQHAREERLKGEIAALQARIAAPTPAFDMELQAWEKEQARPVDWRPLEIADFRSEGKATLSRLTDGSLLAGGPHSDSDTYVLTARPADRGLTALRLEALPHESLPGGGPGRAAGTGELVLTGLRVTASARDARPPAARFVRIENPGSGRILSLAEVEVFSGSGNVAPRGKASQSSTDFEGPARLAIDGNTNGDYFGARSTTHTATEDNPWWEVDLGAELPLAAITVWNRTDGGLFTRLNNFRVLALGADRKPVWETPVADAPNPSVRLSVSGERPVTLRNASASLSLAGLEPERAIDGDAKSGWAVRGAAGQAHALVFEVSLPPGEAAEVLSVTLEQAAGGGQTLGRFRLSGTSAPAPVRELPAAVRAILDLPAGHRSTAQQEALATYFRPLAPSLAFLHTELAAKRKALTEIKPVAVPVMRELPAEKRRGTHLLLKGNFLTPGESVQPGFPAAFQPLAEGATLDRLGVARWLMSPENPLTARVAVNRFWAQLFGTGLVETEEDFGTQGALPSHPELLDWLALSFMNGRVDEWTNGGTAGPMHRPASSTRPLVHSSIPPAARPWDIKAFLRLIVTSATYRQSSLLTSQLAAKDPRDRLRGRYPRRRLEAEGVRDQALALSGLLAPRLGGPSVYPPQPEGLWRAAFNGERTWPTSTGEDRYRRGLYTFWRRTVPYPSMATFDAPSREICTVRRVPTNTPLQALVTLNDPAYVEMAQALGRRLLREGGASPADRARYGLRVCLARPPQEEQIAALVALYEQELRHYRAHPDASKKLATDPLGPLPEGLDAAEAAAWTVVANVLLNMDGMLTKG